MNRLLNRQPWMEPLLKGTPLLLFAAVFLVFGSLSSRFLQPNNLVNILIQSSSLTILATGMTFVLLTAGVDLSVGAIMYVTAAIAGKMILSGWALPWVLAAILAAGVVYGAVNATLITRLRIMPFIITLATLYLGRGLGLWITETRAMNLPSLLTIGAQKVFGIPLPILVMALVLVIAHLVLTRTPFGRQIYATGHNLENARKAGIQTGLILASVYLISGLCAALGGMISLAQLGAVSPTFGNQREFSAIAAAVLGGTSLFGGRGTVLPGAFLGAILIQTVENGLVIINADPYLYPLVTSSIIFLAVCLDCLRHRLLSKLAQRQIRLEPQG